MISTKMNIGLVRILHSHERHAVILFSVYCKRYSAVWNADSDDQECFLAGSENLQKFASSQDMHGTDIFNQSSENSHLKRLLIRETVLFLSRKHEHEICNRNLQISMVIFSLEDVPGCSASVLILFC